MLLPQRRTRRNSSRFVADPSVCLLYYPSGPACSTPLSPNMRGLFLPFALLYLGASHYVEAGTLSKGSNCSVSSQRLNLGTYQFYSECDSVTYCDAGTGMCELKRCRKDMFPFGYVDDSELPPMCPSGKFCPDEEDQCLDLLPVDSPCQFNRDGRKAPSIHTSKLSASFQTSVSRRPIVQLSRTPMVWGVT